MIYVLTMWDALADRHELVLTGPFDDPAPASEWGRLWSERWDGCLMWQVVVLDEPLLTLRSPSPP